MLKLFLWLRYLRKRKIVFLSVVAVALSVALMVVVDSLFEGYLRGLKESATMEVGDVFLWPRETSIPQYDLLLEKLEEPAEVEAAAPFNLSGGLLYLETGDVREVAITGLDPRREAKFLDWKKSLLMQKTSSGSVDFEVDGFGEADGCWLGVSIVAEPNARTDKYDLDEVKKFIGKTVVLTTAATGKRRTFELRIADIAFTQTYYGDKTLYLPVEKLNRILYGDDPNEHRCGTKIKLKSGIDAGSMKPVVGGIWRRFAHQQFGHDTDAVATTLIITEEENRYEWYAELHKQMAVVMLIFGVICSVSVLLIFCIFYMIVETRLKDIAIIKSCGASSSSVTIIFTGFGACVGIVGSVFGTVIGYVITSNIDILVRWVRIVFGLTLWQSSSYMLKDIPSQVYWPAVLPIAAAATIGCCIGALIPAIVAARTKPVEILRYE